ncbi:hypothetical protein E4U42_003811 [Claviceps africana]|uniref:Uncharacterized protein n=1 Tax=Claviceps africana TaxID=83212 RepID=A0A8K0J8L0_9HYPO|nr:hypothetical protein E4U42_003811 [Claviceps africana]
MDAQGPGMGSAAPTARSKKQLRHEKHKPRNGGGRGAAGRAAAGVPEADVSAFERVRRLKHFDRFRGDVEDRLTELIDVVLAGEAVEPRADRRDELARLMLWHAEFHALARGGADRNAESMGMRTLIAELRGCFDRVTDKELRDTERAPYDALIKAYSMKKKQKESRRRRSQGQEE